jgi:predicted nucleotidyltransferase
MCKKIDWQSTETLWRDWPNVMAVWAFGSAQTGEVKRGSDADVAVWGERPFTLDERLQILDQLQAQLQFDDIDLIILNNANVILRFEAVSGRLLFCRDMQQMAAFVSLTAREYEDEMAQWQRALQARQTVSNIQ